MTQGMHTTAPWMVEPINDGDTYQIATADKKPYRFAILAETTGGTEEDKANAALMAAAPCLFDALEQALERLKDTKRMFKEHNQIPEMDGAIAYAEKVLAKAGGV